MNPLKNYLNTYGVILRKNNRTEQAVRSYELVMRIAPNFADVYYNCGNALNELDRKSEAIQRFKTCLEINPKHASAYHNCANSLRDLKEIDDALEYYSKSAELEYENPDMPVGLGMAARSVGIEQLNNFKLRLVKRVIMRRLISIWVVRSQSRSALMRPAML